MIAPRRAPVRPRAFSPVSGEALLLEEMVRDLVVSARRGLIQIVGPAGSGKTTALEHLADFFVGNANVHFLDCPSWDEVQELSKQGWVVFARSKADENEREATRLRLAPWREDEWIEYLLATHNAQCASVMARLKASDEQAFLEGSPELWRIVLDRMATAESIAKPRGALQHYLETLTDEDLGPLVGEAALIILSGDPSPYLLEELHLLHAPEAMFRALAHRPVQLLWAVDRIMTDLRENAACVYFCARFPRELVAELGIAAPQQPKALNTLFNWFVKMAERQPMAASILHASRTGWKPESATGARLAGAYLDHAHWPQVSLHMADLREVDLSEADLRRANLDEAQAYQANLSHINLQGSSLTSFMATEADLSHADLSEARGNGAGFRGANLDGAILARAVLPNANFTAANLARGQLTDADLRGARFTEAQVKETDFAGANLEGAELTNLDLRETRFNRARFVGAELSGCNLEDTDLAGADFSRANLERALLTGSVMPDACFDGACLKRAGLAEIDWHRASLRDADLRGASFHLGSSRSGRVGSPIACEGSRTGFYTDDYTEQDFKSPEEIRKANLCQADLRGANIEGVDFYLVDLRGARLDPEQEPHLRRCGAILESRC